MRDISKIIGLTVVAIKKQAGTEAACYILFNDSKTYIKLEEQDYYDNHDCNHEARELMLRQDSAVWEGVMNLAEYQDVTIVDFLPY